VIGTPVFGSTTVAVSAGNGRPMLPGFDRHAGRFVTTMAPVSVCQNVSWNQRPNASWPQRTASG